MPEISLYIPHTVLEDNIRKQQSVANLSTCPKHHGASVGQSTDLTKLCSALVQHYLN